MPETSVIVVNYNGKHLLKECLDSLREQTYKDFETIVVDNASRDGSVTFLKDNYPEVKVIQCEKNLGYGGGNNRGLSVAKGEYIVFLNNDTRADRDWLLHLVSAAKKDDGIGMCASKILNYDNPDVIDNTGLLIYPDGIARGRGRLQKDRGQFDEQKDVLFPSGCAGLYKKKMLDEIGWFDEDFFLYMDDVDIGLRGRLAGWKCIFVPEAVVYHKYSATTRPYSMLKAYLVERNRIWLILKYYPVDMVLLSVLYTTLRYLYQAAGILRGRGAGSRIVKEESTLKLILLLFKAYISAMYSIKKICKARKQLKKIRKISSLEFKRMLKRHSLPLKELAFIE